MTRDNFLASMWRLMTATLRYNADIEKNLSTHKVLLNCHLYVCRNTTDINRINRKWEIKLYIFFLSTVSFLMILKLMLFQRNYLLFNYYITIIFYYITCFNIFQYFLTILFNIWTNFSFILKFFQHKIPNIKEQLKWIVL